MKIIFIRPKPRATNASSLQACFSETGLTSAGCSTKLRFKAIMPSLLLQTNWRPSFSKVFENPPYLTFFSLNLMLINPVKKAKKASMIAKELKIRTNYLEFSDVFLEKKALILLVITNLNKQAIELQERQQSACRLIYSLGLVKFEMFKTYIKINLANDFIQPSKSPAGISLLFIRMSDDSLHLCVNYWGLNNLTIKN